MREETEGEEGGEVGRKGERKENARRKEQASKREGTGDMGEDKEEVERRLDLQQGCRTGKSAH
eukprot:748020-Hanusia_phi.AAC.7